MLKPVQDNVCLTRIVASEEMVNGLYIPDSAKEDANIGIIEALGTDPEMLEVLSVGDKVIYRKFAGTEVKFEDETYLIVKFADILCVVE